MSNTMTILRYMVSNGMNEGTILYVTISNSVTIHEDE